MKKFNEKLLNKLQKNIPSLIFALICGVAYFIILMQLIYAYTSFAGLMALFIFPAVICGAAYIIIKVLRKAFDNEDAEQGRKIALITFYANAWIILVALLMVISSVKGIII